MMSESGNGMITEYCSECCTEIEMRWDVEKDGYKAYCPVCGSRLMLCDECLRGDGVTERYCDYDARTDMCRFNTEGREYAEFGVWHDAKTDPPKKRGTYLTCTKGIGWPNLTSYTPEMFVEHNSKYGDYEVLGWFTFNFKSEVCLENDYVDYWMEEPKPPKVDDGGKEDAGAELDDHLGYRIPNGRTVEEYRKDGDQVTR